MTPPQDLAEARQALIEQIVSMARAAKSSSTVLDLAEAYAWLAEPAGPHRGRERDAR